MLLKVKDLKTYFYTRDGIVKSVDGVDFSVEKGKILGIVGESGCGKSVTSLSILQLIDSPPGKIVGGEIIFEDEDLLDYTEEQMRKIRGNKISMIFQEPMTSLNPVFTVGVQIEEAIINHQGVSKQDARKKAIEMLKLVKIPGAEDIINQYPHKLSGGMRQRIMIAMALSCNPKLLIADEPTTALDVTIQAQVLELIKELKNKLDTGVMLITHDLGVIADMADNIIVMYAGKVVEDGTPIDIFKNSKHPYTVGLMKSKPNILKKLDKLYSIKGSVPNPLNRPRGCAFHPRCEKKLPICLEKAPELIEVSKNHKVRCWLYG